MDGEIEHQRLGVLIVSPGRIVTALRFPGFGRQENLDVVVRRSADEIRKILAAEGMRSICGVMRSTVSTVSTRRLSS
jgi:hypothetical protein